MRYATVTDDHDELHRQHIGSTTALCGLQALYDVDTETARYGLLSGDRHLCPRCRTVEALLPTTRADINETDTNAVGTTACWGGPLAVPLKSM
ncbi:hypothetical protein [Streptomyces sp. NRRL S-1868]|uniref:hypothetical protein n=1 Tax=Streptomyces sp. NRRL S-1868 TaxID=1463892 RepID=UPI0004CAA215|nr:hypothetical protein [Streptomyces sp. NRRL S-1868]